MRARFCFRLIVLVVLGIGRVSGQNENPRDPNPARLQISLEIATTTDDGRASSVRVEVKNVGDLVVWMPVLGQECTYVRVKWGGLLEGSACGISGGTAISIERIGRDWVQLRPGEFMSSTVAVHPPADDRGKEYWIVYEPPRATKREVIELLHSGYAIPTGEIESEHQTYTAR